MVCSSCENSPFVLSRERNRSLGNTGPGFYVNEQLSPRLLPSTVSQIQAKILFRESYCSENRAKRYNTQCYVLKGPLWSRPQTIAGLSLIHLNLKVGVQRKASSFSISLTLTSLMSGCKLFAKSLFNDLQAAFGCFTHFCGISVCRPRPKGSAEA